jgi:hypothetical protein
MDLDSEYQLFLLKNEPLYSSSEISERINGLVEIMFDNDEKIEYQPFAIKIILYELFQNANQRHREKINNLKN